MKGKPHDPKRKNKGEKQKVQNGTPKVTVFIIRMQHVLRQKLNWVALKELNLSYWMGEDIFINIYPVW